MYLKLLVTYPTLSTLTCHRGLQRQALHKVMHGVLAVFMSFLGYAGGKRGKQGAVQDIGRKDESDISKLVRMIMARQFDPVRPASGSLCCMRA